MITSVEICKDAIDVHENHLLESETNSFTIKFIEKILNVEKLDLVILIKD